MEIFQQCLTELLRVVVLVIIAGFGVLARMYLVPLLKSWVEKAKSAADLAGIDLTAEQIEQAKEIIAAMVASAYRLKLGGKIEDAKTYVNELAKTELAKLGIELSDEMIDEFRRAALGELERTMAEWKTLIEIEGETEEYAFDLNEFFSVTNGKFNYNSSVDKFLDALTKQSKYPFSTPELRNELKHTFWILDRVDSAKALAKKLREHPVFKDYEIVLAAGDGKLDDNDETMKSYDKVVKAIANNDKTITLSVGQLTTGITIPEWTAVLMLSNMKSPALYMQAAFRAQNPCLFKEGKYFKRKENIGY